MEFLFFEKKKKIQAVWNCFKQFSHERFFLFTFFDHMKASLFRFVTQVLG